MHLLAKEAVVRNGGLEVRVLSTPPFDEVNRRQWIGSYFNKTISIRHIF